MLYIPYFSVKETKSQENKVIHTKSYNSLVVKPGLELMSPNSESPFCQPSAIFITIALSLPPPIPTSFTILNFFDGVSNTWCGEIFSVAHR